MRRRTVGAVEHVIVHQRRRVQQLHHLRHRDDVVAEAAAVAGATHGHARQEGHHRAKLLAAEAADVLDERRHLLVARRQVG
jgi:hypothetical protein